MEPIIYRSEGLKKHAARNYRYQRKSQGIRGPKKIARADGYAKNRNAGSEPKEKCGAEYQVFLGRLPEEIADHVVMEMEGRPTGRDVIAALDGATAGPTYRAGILRGAAMKRLADLAAQHGVPSVAFEMLGPPRLTKLLFEAHLCSRLYRSAPLGREAQPDFVNAVACLDTGLEPPRLLAELQAIEKRHGRERPFTDAPRTLDLDLLLYGDEVIASTSLTVPHPRMHERAFVLRPLAEISPAVSVPGRGTATQLLRACVSQDVEPVA